MKVLRLRFYIWLAWVLPRQLVAQCAYRVGAHATTGRWSAQIVPDLKFMEAMQRWGQEQE